MSIPDILEVDLPVIIVLVVLWLIDWRRRRRLERGPLGRPLER